MAAAASHAIRGTIRLGEGKTSLAVGDWAEWTRTWGPAAVAQFAQLSGDDNPVHLEEEYAATTQFKRPIVHGMLYGSMIGTMFGGQIPGSIYMSQDFKFRKPVFVGDTVTARIEVVHTRARPHIVTCDTSVVNSEGQRVMDGQAKVLVLER